MRGEVMTEVTWHGKNRLKERVGIPKRASQKQTQRAFEKGISIDETVGSLRNYLDGVYLREGTANNLRVWNGSVYIFKDETLLTVYALPSRFRKTELTIMKKKKEINEENENEK